MEAEMQLNRVVRTEFTYGLIVVALQVESPEGAADVVTDFTVDDIMQSVTKGVNRGLISQLNDLLRKIAALDEEAKNGTTHCTELIELNCMGFVVRLHLTADLDIQVNEGLVVASMVSHVGPAVVETVTDLISKKLFNAAADPYNERIFEKIGTDGPSAFAERLGFDLDDLPGANLGGFLRQLHMGARA